MSSSTEGLTVAVIGGGIGGVTLTLALLSRGVSVQLYEKAEAFGEYGAGLTFGANAVAAMRACDARIHAAFEQVANRPDAGGRPDVFMEMVDGSGDESRTAAADPAVGYVHHWDGVSAAAHRAHFLNALVKNLPDGVAHLGKELVGVEDDEDPKDDGDRPCTLSFADGSTATAHVVVGYDGIGSRLRRHIVGQDSPAARATYSHQYIYRMVVPIQHGIELLGEERARTGTIWIGHGNRVITFPIAGGRMLNLSSVKRVDSSEGWPDPHQFVVKASAAEVLRDASGLSPALVALLTRGSAMGPVDRWGIFDLAEAQPEAYARGRVCIAGDAAHAAGPHLGAGAAFAIEDAAVLATVLSDARLGQGATGGRAAVEAALRAYQDVRMPRASWLPVATRRSGDLTTYSADGVGDDWTKLRPEVESLSRQTWDFDVDKMLDEAREALGKRLSEVAGK